MNLSTNQHDSSSVQLRLINDLVKEEVCTCVRVYSEAWRGSVPLHYPILDLPVDPCVGIVGVHAQDGSARG